MLLAWILRPGRSRYMYPWSNRNMYSYFRTTLLYILIYNVSKICADTGSLEQMNDEDMLNLIRTENYVITLFSTCSKRSTYSDILYETLELMFYTCLVSAKQNCPDCEKLEDVLYQIREDLVDSLNAWVVKCENSQLVRIYSPSLEPALVFFRHGVPLLYHGRFLLIFSISIIRFLHFDKKIWINFRGNERRANFKLFSRQ